MYLAIVHVCDVHVICLKLTCQFAGQLSHPTGNTGHICYWSHLVSGLAKKIGREFMSTPFKFRIEQHPVDVPPGSQDGMIPIVYSTC